MIPSLNDLHDFARRYTAAWCSRNASSVAAFFAPNGSLSVNGVPNVGHRAIAEMAQGFMTAFPDLELLMENVHIESERAVYRWTFIGTNTGPGGTGHRVRFSGFEEWRFGEDGLVAESQGHFDATDYQHQLQHGVKDFQK
jgi:predicted ester cyclase